MPERTLKERFPTCREVVELVTDYLEGQLPPGERERFERHVATCDGCTEFIEQIRLTIRAAGGLKLDDVPADHRDDLIAAFRDLLR